MQIKAIVDRFEGNKGVLLVGEDEKQVVWPRVLLPDEVAEGDILQMDLQIDKEATRAAKLAGENLLQQVIEKNKN